MLVRSQIVNNLISFLIIMLFVYTGSSKLIAHNLFLSQLSQIPYLKKSAPLVSVSLPILELVTGLLIVFNRTQIFGWWFAFALMGMFTAYVAVMLLSKSSLPCTCGGVIASMSWKQHLVFNVFCMSLSLTGLCQYYYQSISTNKRE